MASIPHDTVLPQYAEAGVIESLSTPASAPYTDALTSVQPMISKARQLHPDARRLLDHLRRGGSYGYYWIVSEAADAKGKPEKITSWWNGTGPGALPADHGPLGARHLYFGVHPVRAIPQKRTAKNGGTFTPDPARVRPRLDELAAINCLYAEFDAAPAMPPDAPPPSVVTESSSGKFHYFWLLRDTFLLDSPEALTRAKALQAAWVGYVGSDDDAKDLTRVLRVPGTYNYKPKYAPHFPLVRFVEADFERLYTLDELEACLPTPPARPSASSPTSRSAAPARASANYNEHAQQVLNRWRSDLRNAQDDHRHRIARTAAIMLGRLVGHGLLDKQQVIGWLVDDAHAAGTSDRRIDRYITSAVDLGVRTFGKHNLPGSHKPAATPTPPPAAPSGPGAPPKMQPEEYNTWLDQRHAAGLPGLSLPATARLLGLSVDTVKRLERAAGWRRVQDTLGGASRLERIDSEHTQAVILHPPAKLEQECNEESDVSASGNSAPPCKITKQDNSAPPLAAQQDAQKAAAHVYLAPSASSPSAAAPAEERHSADDEQPACAAADEAQPNTTFDARPSHEAGGASIPSADAVMPPLSPDDPHSDAAFWPDGKVYTPIVVERERRYVRLSPEAWEWPTLPAETPAAPAQPSACAALEYDPAPLTVGLPLVAAGPHWEAQRAQRRTALRCTAPAVQEDADATWFARQAEQEALTDANE